MSRRGQGISLNVIVIAAIALLVLVILSVLVLRTGRVVVEGTSCEATGGRCAFDCFGDEFPDRGAVCDSGAGLEQVCCRSLTTR